MFNETAVVNGLRTHVNYTGFANATALMTEGARINMRLRDMLFDPAIVDTNAAERAIRTVYRDVYDFLRDVMFKKNGDIVWTFAGQLERAGFTLSRATNGLNLKVGNYTVNIPSPLEPNYLTNADIVWMAACLNVGATNGQQHPIG